jgi:hypothetical protein
LKPVPLHVKKVGRYRTVGTVPYNCFNFMNLHLIRLSLSSLLNKLTAKQRFKNMIFIFNYLRWIVCLTSGLGFTGAGLVLNRESTVFVKSYGSKHPQTKDGVKDKRHKSVELIKMCP